MTIDFNHLLKIVPCSAYWKDRDGVYLGCNFFMAKMAGLSHPDEVIGKTDRDLPWHESAPALREADEQVIKTGKTITIEETGKLANGKLATYLSIKVPLLSSDNKIIGIFGLSIDISKQNNDEFKLPTQKYITEDQIRLSNLYLQNILANLPEPIYWMNKEGVMLGCNDAEAKIFKFNNASELVGKTLYELIPIVGLNEEIVNRLRKNDIEVMQTGEPKIVEEVNFKDGVKHTYLSHKAPLRNEKNEIIGVIGASVDITKQKQIENELKITKKKLETKDRAEIEELSKLSQQLMGNTETEYKNAHEYALDMINYLENIIACMPASVYWKDRSGIYRGCNDYLARLIGLKSRSEIVGKTDYEITKKLHSNEAMAEYIKNVDMGVMQSGIAELNHEEKPFYDLNGKVVYQLTNKVPLRDKNNKVIGVVGISIDITERKQMEQELHRAKEKAEIASQAKSNFLAVMSHELRTPLNAIIGMAQIMKNRDLTEEQEDCVDVVMQSGKNLLALINDILDFSRLDAGRLAIKPSIFNLYDLIREIEVSMAPQLDGRPIKLIVDFEKKKLPEQLIGDQLRIKQIITNLITNAMKFTDKGHIKVIVSEGKSTSKKKANIEIAVEDTGIGIPEDKLKSVFERFTQVESTYSRRYGGVGLGLTICKQLVEGMGGRIGVKSKVGKGSTFFFNLPLEIADTKLPKAKTTKKQWPKIDFKRKPHLLLVEDNLLNQKVAKVMLEELGCVLDIADNGKKAIDMYKKKKYDLIFMDIGLPDMDGLHVTETIRKLEKGSKRRVPIVNMTAHVLQEDIDNCMKSGADGVISKPVMQDDLIAILKKWLITKKS